MCTTNHSKFLNFIEEKNHVKMYNYQEKIIISYSRVLQFATTGRQARKI